MELPKLLDGLGVGSLLHRNLALLFKWLSRFFNEPKALWIAIVADKYGYSRILNFAELTVPRIGAPWKSIGNTVLNHLIKKQFWLHKIRKNVGRGNHTLFWHELWVGDIPFKTLNARLISICVNPSATITPLGIWDDHESLAIFMASYFVFV